MNKPDSLLLKLIDAEIIRRSRRLCGKGVVLNEFERSGVARSHQRKLQHENLPEASEVS